MDNIEIMQNINKNSNSGTKMPQWDAQYISISWY